MRKTLAVACLMLFVHSLPCRAEGPQGIPPPIVAVSTILQLSEDQVHALISMIEVRDTAIRPLAEELQSNAQALEQLLRSPDADASTVGRLMLEIRALNVRIGEIRGQAAAQFEQVLTPDQRERLQHIREAASLSDAVPAFRATGLV